MLNLRTLTVLTAFGILAIGMGASSKPSVTERINQANADIKVMEASTRALTRGKLLAKDEATNDDALKAKACASFKASPLNVTCD